MDDIDSRRYFLTHQLFNCGSPNKIYRTALVREANARFLQGVAYEEPSFVYPLFFYAKRIYQLDAKLYFYRLHDTSTMSSYITKPGKLYDHPFVQLAIYKQIRSIPEFYSVYKDEIDYYFLFTFYIETLYFQSWGICILDMISSCLCKTLSEIWFQTGMKTLIYNHFLQNQKQTL